MGDKFRVSVEDGWAMFRCPGCKGHHTISINRPGSWAWNGSVSAPTVSPSILSKSGHFDRPGNCWCTFNAARPDSPASFECHLCHSYVTDGKIQFLGDCSHALAGQTVELPDWE
jgi:hypothetical protein